ncbi:4-hydroxy-3-methylbut-2-enyl diphosphate reductase, partial [Candidatus Poribacteria bacterium]|nr:4-hydroxy-3-methylbut-2-enyl diphosphate reductase [Candidatus Poribacteria bacterium]
RMIGESLLKRHPGDPPERHFRSFDTICSATQDRQDAILELVRGARLDLVLVIGGFNSSNTGHLLEVALEHGRAYHIEDVSNLVSREEIRHLPHGAKEPAMARGWLPDGLVRIGLTAGASTPNRAIADTIARVMSLRGLSVESALAGLVTPAKS